MSATIREMHPARMRDLPRWEVSLDGRVIGWVQAHRIGRSPVMFFRATGIDPEGEHVNLENSTDRDERVEVVIGFHRDPEPWRGIHWHPSYAPAIEG